MATKTTPAADLGHMRDLQDDQEVDAKALAKAITKHREQVEQLDPRTYAPEFLAQRRRELDDEMAKIRTIVQRMESRAAEAKAGAEQWQPSRRRMAAAVSDPMAAEALARRLDRATHDELARLAEEAKANDDWRLADALVGQLDRRRGSLDAGEMRALSTRVAGVLDTMDGERAAEALQFAARTGRAFVEGAIALAEADGRPMPAAERLSMVRAHGADRPEPVEV